jgi:hypothetical protein
MLAFFAFIFGVASAQQFTSFTVAPPIYLEPNQTGLTFYTGQNMSLSWTSEGLATNQTVKFNYLTTALIQNSGNYTARISDTAAQLVNQPIIISLSNNASISLNSTPVSVIQSKILYANLYTNLTNPVGTSTIPCGQNVTVQWQGLGQAGSGLTTVTIRSTGGGGGGGTTVGTALTVIAQNGLMVMNYLLPASFAPSGFATYLATVTSGTYTLNSQGFRLSAASPTPSSTATPSKTPSASPSLGATSSTTPTPTPTPSQTPTPSLSFGSTASTTPSQTPSASLSSSLSSSITPSETSSSTPTPTTPINLGAIAAAASQQSMNLIYTIIGSVGGLLAVCGIGFIVYRVQSHKKMRERRLRAAATMSSRMNDINNIYGVSYVRKQPMAAYKSSKILTVK